MPLEKAPLSYLGVRATEPGDVINAKRAPTTHDVGYLLGSIWNYNNSGTFITYELAGVSAGSAVWNIIGGGTVEVSTLTGDSGGAISPTGGTITLAGGTGIQTVGSGSTITFNVTGDGFKTTVVTADTAMAVNSGYVTNKAGTAATMTLPAVAAVGDSVKISGLGSTSYTIAQNAGQSVHLNATTSTVGVGGSVTPTTRYQTMEIMCVVANTEWDIVYTSDAVTIV